MSSISFDTRSSVKRLVEAGFTQQQAEAQAEALIAVVNENLATKHDVELIRRDVKELELRLTVRTGTVLVAAVAILPVLVKLL
jgi:hypothetical protein